MDTFEYQEHTEIDRRAARYVNENLADYLIPVNADVPDVKVLMIPEVDTRVNPLGIKGIGEIGIVGMMLRSRTPYFTRRANVFASCRSARSDCCSVPASSDSSSHLRASVGVPLTRAAIASARPQAENAAPGLTTRRSCASFREDSDETLHFARRRRSRAARRLDDVRR